MSKRKFDEQGETWYNVGRRRAIGVLLQGNVHLLTMLTKHLMAHIKEVDDQWGIVDVRERAQLAKAKGELLSARKRLHVVGRRMRG